ncbi:5499_t:CDS:2 [Entrophospora sp. SA101]|nr:5499_t:CDS:2 [Entrophospora sp. SA101]
MSSQDNINPNWQKIENDVKTKLIKFLQSDEESISLDINSINKNDTSRYRKK